MHTRILHIFTRTPLHVGAGSSVGAIDQPVIRERHTGFPVIPGSALKGVFADAWNDELVHPKKKSKDGTETEQTDKWVRPDSATSELCWLFGNEDASASAAGALLFGEARLLAFPVRSAKGGFAWVTSPLAVNRAIRDGVFGTVNLAEIKDDIGDDKAKFDAAKLGLTSDGGKAAVLEDQPLTHAGGLPPELAAAFAALPNFANNADRLVLVSDGSLSYFAATTCEVAQHVKINDATGTAAAGALYNQENVPSDTLFYAPVRAVARVGTDKNDRTPEKALDALGKKINAAKSVFQFGADATTGLGFCTVNLK